MMLFPLEATALVGFGLLHDFFKYSVWIVFMSPEKAVQSPWRNIFQTPYYKKHLTLVAVDEAHCIPEWLDKVK